MGLLSVKLVIHLAPSSAIKLCCPYLAASSQGIAIDSCNNGFPEQCGQWETKNISAHVGILGTMTNPWDHGGPWVNEEPRETHDYCLWKFLDSKQWWEHDHEGPLGPWGSLGSTRKHCDRKEPLGTMRSPFDNDPGLPLAFKALQCRAQHF